MYSRCLLIGVALMFFQQFGGINTIMYYGPTLMKKIGLAGESKEDQIIAAVPLACINAFCTLLAMLFIDNRGRRWILLRFTPIVATSLFVVSIGISIFSYSTSQDV